MLQKSLVNFRLQRFPQLWKQCRAVDFAGFYQKGNGFKIMRAQLLLSGGIHFRHAFRLQRGKGIHRVMEGEQICVKRKKYAVQKRLIVRRDLLRRQGPVGGKAADEQLQLPHNLHLQIIYKRRLQQADAQRLRNQRLGIICILNVAAVDQRKAVELPCVSHTESQARPGKCRERSFLK